MTVDAPDGRPALVMDDVRGATVRNLVATEPADGAPLAWLRDSRECRLEPDVEANTQAMLLELRAGAPAQRRSWLLDITTDIGIPAVASLSCRSDGSGFAFGLAARRTQEQAARFLANPTKGLVPGPDHAGRLRQDHQGRHRALRQDSTRGGRGGELTCAGSHLRRARTCMMT